MFLHDFAFRTPQEVLAEVTGGTAIDHTAMDHSAMPMGGGMSGMSGMGAMAGMQGMGDMMGGQGGMMGQPMNEKPAK